MKKKDYRVTVGLYVAIGALIAGLNHMFKWW